MRIQPFLLLVLLSSVACSDPVQSAADSGGSDLGTDKWGPPVKLTNLSITRLATMPTMLKVSWESSRPCTSRVKFGTSAAHDLSTPQTSTPATKHQATLIGLPASSDVFVEAVATPADGAPSASIKGKARTGAQPSTLPVLKFSSKDPSKVAGGYTLILVLFAKSTWITIVDIKGRFVWWKKANLRVLSAHLSIDRKAVVLLKRAYSTTVGGLVERIPLDGSASSEVKATGGHTEFVEIADGKYAVLGWDIRKYGNRKILGNTIMEVSAGAPIKVAWNIFDHIKPNLNMTFNNGIYGADPTVEDWSHVNGIHYDQKSNSYYVTTGPALNMAIRYERGKSKIRWSLGANGTIKAGDGSKPVSSPHSIQNLDSPNKVLLFNRDVPGGCSYVSEVAVDETNKKATTTWSHKSKAGYQVYFLGDAERLHNGNTLINWTTSGHIEEVTKSGEVVWSVLTMSGDGFGFTERVRSLYKN